MTRFFTSELMSGRQAAYKLIRCDFLRTFVIDFEIDFSGSVSTARENCECGAQTISSAFCEFAMEYAVKSSMEFFDWFRGPVLGLELRDCCNWADFSIAFWQNLRLTSRLNLNLMFDNIFTREEWIDFCYDLRLNSLVISWLPFGRICDWSRGPDEFLRLFIVHS